MCTHEIVFTLRWKRLFLLAATCLAAEPRLKKAPGEGFSLAGQVHDRQALNRAHDVELQGELAFVAGKGGSLAIIDVSRPTKPELLSSLVDPVGLEDAETVLPMGKILLLGARDLIAIDISDPRRPTIVRRLSDRSKIDKINGMALRGSHLFTANKTGSVAVFDVSDPSNPKRRGVLNTRTHGGLRSPHDIAVFGDRIIVVNAARESDAYVRVYQVADPKTHRLLPVEKWREEGAIGDGDPMSGGLQGANRAALAGRHACIGAFVHHRVGLIDLGRPRQLTQTANAPFCDLYATGMAATGKVLFVAGGQCVEAFDISDPSRPLSIARYCGGDLFPTRRYNFNAEIRQDNAHDLVYRNGFVYVTAQNDHSLGVLKVTNPRVLKLAK